MSNVKIYLTENCPYCIRAKKFLVQKKVAFTEIDLTNKPEELQALKNKTGWQTVPQIFINEKLIGGYTDMMALEDEGKLDTLLGTTSK